jgi:hypothetical protein
MKIIVIVSLQTSILSWVVPSNDLKALLMLEIAKVKNTLKFNFCYFNLWWIVQGYWNRPEMLAAFFLSRSEILYEIGCKNSTNWCFFFNFLFIRFWSEWFYSDFFPDFYPSLSWPSYVLETSWTHQFVKVNNYHW